MSTDEKARAYLTEGKVKAQHVGEFTALFHVTGSQPGDPYFVKFSKVGGWKCDCPARVDECAHVKACRLVTDLTTEDTGNVSFGFTPNADIDAILNG